MENLIAGHAYWSDRKRQLKAEGCEEAAKCDKTSGWDIFISRTTPKSCIELVIESIKDQFDGYYAPTFNEVWNEMVEDGEVCQHCQNVRSLKRERMKASRRLGAIRSAMTKMGRKIQYIDKHLNKCTKGE